MRLGFGLDLPAGNWTITPVAMGANVPVMTAYEARDGARLVMFFGMFLDRADDSFVASMMEQGVARTGLEKMGVPTRTDTTLGGMRARRIDWEGKVQAVTASTDGAVLAIVISGPDLDAADNVYRGFRLLP